MDLDRFEYVLREALREEAEKIVARDDERSRKDLFMLMQGAEHCLAQRLGVVSNASVSSDDPKAYRRGWEIAAKIDLNRRSAAS